MSEAIIPTLPDVKMCAAKAIARSARSGKLSHFIMLTWPSIVLRFYGCRNKKNQIKIMILFSFMFYYCRFGNFCVTFISRNFYFLVIRDLLNSRASTHLTKIAI